MGATGLRAHLAGNTDLVLTGEGAIDAQTLTGKTPAGVAGAAREAGVPVIAFAGRVDPGSPALEAVAFFKGVPKIRYLSTDSSP